MEMREDDVERPYAFEPCRLGDKALKPGPGVEHERAIPVADEDAGGLSRLRRNPAAAAE